MIIDTILEYCREVKSNRSAETAYDHMHGEMLELYDELFLGYEGEDGVMGEAIDIILCAMDIIYQHNPNVTAEEIECYMQKKLEKFKRVQLGTIQ